MTPRRAFAAVALAAVVATRVEPAYLEMIVDREGHARSFVPITDARWPHYAAFMEQVRSKTAPGDTIALVISDSEPREAYPLAYYRASYFLAGREVLPVIDPQAGGAIPQNRTAARYIAAFGETPAAGELVWKGEGGALYRR